MRILEFSNVKQYEMLYEGLLASHALKGAENRIMGKVLDKLEKIGTPLETKGTVTFYTLAESSSVELEDAEYNLAKRQIGEVEWVVNASRRAADLLDFIENAPTKEQFEARKVGVLSLEKKSETTESDG